MPSRNGFLELQGLGKRYGDTPVVTDCNLSIAEGEFICLLGPSGCGKTTTLQMIAGFVEPTAGRVRLNGTDITALKPSQRGLGVVFQSYALFPHMTVAQNVAFGLELRKVSAAERRQRVDAALEQVRLGALAARYPKELSGGQRQRVALARANWSARCCWVWPSWRRWRDSKRRRVVSCRTSSAAMRLLMSMWCWRCWSALASRTRVSAATASPAVRWASASASSNSVGTR